MLDWLQIPCLADNYGYLVRDRDTGACASIDTPDAQAILAVAKEAGWRITEIWNTHWHADHAGGNSALCAATGAKVTGPSEITRIAPAPDRLVAGGMEVSLGASRARVMDVAGHTLGHVAYVFDADRIAFVGDALFSLGCGRLFEGDARQMWESLKRLRALEDDYLMFCAHEYSAANARFALSVDPDNPDLRARADDIAQLRARGRPTVPMRLDVEKAANPFLRAEALKASLGLEGQADWEAFARLRKMKDVF